MSTTRRKLAYVVNSLNPGGTERLVVEMGLAYARDYDVTVLCLDEPGGWAGRLRDEGVPVHCLWRQPGLDLSVSFRLAQHFRRSGTHVIHAHQCTPWFYSALSRLWHAAPRLLFQEHGRFHPETEHRMRVLVNRLLIRRLTHRSVAVSEDIRRRLERYEGLDPSAIDVVYNGVRPEPSLSRGERDALRRQFGFGAEHFVVGTVGRFDPIKNLPMLVEALARAGDSIAGLRGLLIGDGPELPRVRALIERTGLAQRVCLTGYRDDASRLAQCLDLFVLSSHSEGTSLALLEAMAAGVPVAVTDVGGNPEVVSRDRTGWVVAPGSVGELSAAILEATADVSKRVRFGEAGRRRFEDRYTMDGMLARYDAYYRSFFA